MRQASRIVVAALLTALLLAGPAAWSPARAAGAPAFEPAPCDLPDVADVLPRLRCGTVRVPRDHARPDGPTVALAVVVVASAEGPARADPVVYISGGPGAPLTVYAGHQARRPYAPGRDLVLVDQRGTGRSEPRLCDDLGRRLLGASLAVAADPVPEVRARAAAAYAACREEAVARGIDLTTFGSRATAEDFEGVRRALGIEAWNLYGESYGTTVAMTLAALHPEHVRSVVLDSVYPPDPVPPWSERTADARRALFAACAADGACAGAFPDLAGTFDAALRRLAEAPPTIAVASPGVAATEIRLTAPLFAAMVNNLIYYPPNYPGLPALIASVRDGAWGGASAALSELLTGFATQNLALHAAVECRDRPHLRVALPAEADPLDRMVLDDVCAEWSALGPAPLVPTGGAVPVLVLAGEFDPVARPALSRRVAEAVGATWVMLAGIGHNVRGFSPCGARIASDFIEEPGRRPDLACAGRGRPVLVPPARSP